TKGTAIVTSVLADKKASLETISSAIELWREYSVNRLNSELVGAVVRTGKPVARIAAARYLAGAGDINAAALLVADLTGPDADAERANLAFLKGDKAAADSISKAILELDKTHCAALGTQAALLFEAGKNNAALRSSQRAASECPHQSGLWVLAARIYSKLGDPANARRTFRQVIDTNKQSEPLTRAFVEWLLSKNNEREAVAAARRITRSAPALISGWRLYSETCIRTRSDCVAEAKRGMFDATTRYGIDLLPGELPPNGLFGRFVIR
ncbi:MAG: tetratricopeptide repeat protein, partial [Sphingorhabdus sp.]